MYPRMSAVLCTLFNYRPMWCFLLKNPLSTWFHILHYRGNYARIVLRLSTDFGVSPVNYFLLNSRHPSYQILATPLVTVISSMTLVPADVGRIEPVRCCLL